MSVFEYLDYKVFLAADIKSNSAVRGYQTQLAQAAGCQRAFVSQVLYGKVHLTMDHAVGLIEFWKMTEKESDYFFTLLQLARASTEKLRSLTIKKINRLKAEQSNLSSKFKKTSFLTESQQAKYYSSWSYAAIHVISSIEKYQQPRQMAQRLKLSQSVVEQICDELVEMEILEKRAGNHYSPAERNVFLPRQSHMTYMLHSNWRLRALLDVQDENPNSIHYSTLHGMSLSDIEKLRTIIHNFLKDSKQLVEKSPEEEVICLNLDFFQI